MCYRYNSYAIQKKSSNIRRNNKTLNVLPTTADAMGIRKCSITDCRSVSGKQEHRGVTFHSFPINPITRALWVENCSLPETKAITKSTLVCSRHFRRADFQPLKNDKYLLRQGAVPTIFPWGNKPALAMMINANAGAAALRSLGEDLLKAAAAASTMPPLSSPSTTTPTDDTNSSSSVAAAAKPAISETEVLSAINPALKSPPLKRSASADNPKTGQRTKIQRKSLDTSAIGPKAGGGTTAAGSTNKSQPSKSSQRTVPVSFDPVSLFLPGSQIEAQDFKEIWHFAKVVEVDHDEREVLIHFEKTNKGRNSGLADEWISMKSSRLRPIQVPSPKKSAPTYAVGERVHAKWTDSRKFPASVQKVLDNSKYFLIFGAVCLPLLLY